MKIILITIISFLLLIGCSSLVGAQAKLRLVPLKGDKIKLVYGTKTAAVDLESEISGTNAVLPGEPPNVYKVLFTAEKDGFLYLVANIRSRSPISNKNAPCGGDSPQAILWVKSDKTLKTHEFDSQIYESCSYNYYDSKVKITKNGLTIKFDGKTPKELAYNNSEPDKGLIINGGTIKNAPPPVN